MSFSDHEDIQSDNESHYSEEEFDDGTIVLCDECGDTFPPNLDPRSFSSDNLQQLRSGIPLDKTRTKEILRLKRHSKKRKTRLEAEIARHYEIIQKLEREKNMAKLEISWQNGLLTPIRRLPNEILDEIMILVWDESWFPREMYEDKEIVRGREKFHCALILSHVCNYWRQAAIANKKLWSAIDIDESSSRLFLWHYLPSDDCMVGNVRCLPAHKWMKLSLERSGSHPLEVCYERHSLSDEPPYELLMNIHRWGTVSIPYTKLNTIPKDTELSLLDSLFVSGHRDHRPGTDWPRPIGRTPRLRHVRSAQSVAAVALPWSQLTCLTLCKNDDTPEELLGALSQCLQLAKLNLHLENDQPPIDTLKPVTLQTLHVLKVHYSYRLRIRDEDDAQSLHFNICRLFVLPSLNTLVLDSDSGVGTVRSCEQALSLLERSKCRLISFKLGNTKFLEPPHLVDLLGLMPELRVLELHQSDGCEEDPTNEALLNHLIPSSASDTRTHINLPCLRELILRGEFKFDSTGDLVASILHTRTSQDQSSAGQLHSLSIHINRIRGISDDGYITDAELDGSSKEVVRRRKEQLAMKVEKYKAAVEPFKGRNVTIRIRAS